MDVMKYEYEYTTFRS